MDFDRERLWLQIELTCVRLTDCDLSKPSSILKVMLSLLRLGRHLKYAYPAL
jgi:hypothetical protein